jgi:hypothetical protein
MQGKRRILFPSFSRMLWLGFLAAAIVDSSSRWRGKLAPPSGATTSGVRCCLHEVILS